MRRRTLVLGLASAGFIERLAFPDASWAATDDWTVLRTLPLSGTILSGLERDRLRPEHAHAPLTDTPETAADLLKSLFEFSPDSLARIESAPVDLRTLAWLAYLADQPLSDGSDGTDGDGLHKFFFLRDGGVAPQVTDALRYAGFNSKAAVFAEAMSMFGDPYPTSNAARAPHFAWNGPRVHISDTETIVPDLNAFDERLMALGRQFGPMYRLWPDIQTWALGTPALAPWLDAARAHVTDQERMESLLYRLGSRLAPKSYIIARAPHAYATIYAVDLFNSEMLNGSVEQFFSNSSGDIAPEVADALHDIGLDHHASVVRNAMALYPAPYPRDRTARHQASDHTPGLATALDQLTGGVDDGAIGPALLAYARREDVLPR